MFARRRSLAIVVLSLLAATMLGAAPARAGDGAPPLPRGAVDITSTATGQKLIREAKARYEAAGHQSGGLRAVRDASGILIVPVHTALRVYATRTDGDRQGPLLAPLSEDDPTWVQEEAVVSELAASAAAQWQFVTNRCYSQISDTWAVLDHCYTKYKLGSDGSGSYDWYALHRYGTARNNSPWVLDQAKIRAYRSGGGSQAWADWSPRSDWYGGSCSTTSISISSPVGGLSQSFQRCPDRVVFSKSANGSQPDYTQTWFGLGTRGNREVKFEISVRVAQGKSATWLMPASVNGSPY